MSSVRTDGRPPMDAAFQNFKSVDNVVVQHLVAAEVTSPTVVIGELVGDVATFNDLTVENLTLLTDDAGVIDPTAIPLPLITAGGATLTNGASTTITKNVTTLTWTVNVPLGLHVIKIFVTGTANDSIQFTVNGVDLGLVEYTATTELVTSPEFEGGPATVIAVSTPNANAANTDVYGKLIVVAV